MSARRHEPRVARERRADRSAESLREATPSRCRRTRRSRRSATPVAALDVPQPRAVHVHGKPASRATARIARSSSSDVTTPPAPLCVFSTHTRVAPRRVARRRPDGALEVAGASCGPVGTTNRGCTPLERGSARHLPVDDVRVGVDEHLGAGRGVHRDRGLVRHRAGGKNSAASFPSSSATRASSRRVVGSPSSTSSPTSASAIACRIAAVGRVTVSLRRSIGMRGRSRRRSAEVTGAERRTALSPASRRSPGHRTERRTRRSACADRRSASVLTAS